MTYLEYVNIVLQAVNEVPLTVQQLQSARGLHQFTKDSINRAYFDMIGEYKWPWMQKGDATSGQLELTGERSMPPQGKWTQIPVDNPYKDSIDWSTIHYDDKEGNNHQLKVIDWQQYEQSQEYYDAQNSPRYIAQSADGRSMGLLGVPDKDLLLGKLYYRLWTRPSRFEFAETVIPMPDIHHNVLIDGALHHLWSFRGDVDQAQLAYSRFEKGIKKMKQKYTNQSTRMRWA